MTSVWVTGLAALVFASLIGGCSSSESVRDAGPDAPVDAPRDARPGDAGPDAVEPPYLTALAVSASSPRVALIPTFSRGVHDYYVRCAAGVNDLTVSMTASPGALASLTKPMVSAPSPTETLSLGVSEGQAIVAIAATHTESTQYWVRCLPHDFPTMQWSPNADAAAPAPGYYLVGNLERSNGVGGYAMVLDGNGVPVWYFSAIGAGPGAGVEDVDNVVSGAVSFIPTLPTPISTPDRFEVHHLSAGTTALVAPSMTQLDDHELRVLPNGHYLAISEAITPGVDMTGVTAHLPDGGEEALGPGSNVVNCNLVEFDSSGAVAWQWIGTDHFDPAKDSTYTSIYAAVTGLDGGPPVDVFHCNAIDVDPANGNLLVSSRNMSSVFYVDRLTSKVLWKMGGETASKDDAVFVPVADPFYQQHDARLRPGWAASCNGGTGSISLFDDRSFVPGVARAVVYDVVVSGGVSDGGCADGGCTDGGCAEGGCTDSGCADGGCMDGGCAVAGEGGAIVAWQYAGKANTSATGSFRILPDGSSIIGWGIRGLPNPTFTELDSQGNAVLEFSFTDGNSTYRAIKVPLSAFDLNVLRTSTGMP